jgi:catechol 2,3-dioxygenase-like lactoylglutathione lyase family enzyme
VRVIGFDHIVLNVGDVERSLAWYTDVLGLEGERVEEWRRHEVPFPSVRVNAHTVIDLFAKERSGENADHYCMVVEPTDLQALVDSGRLEVVEGPVPRWGAQGVATSIYVKDPDGNTVELRHYGPPPPVT